MKKYLLLFCLLAFLLPSPMAAQSDSKVRIGMTTQYAYLLLSQPYEWSFNLEGYQPGSFSQIGLSLDFQLSKRWSLNTGFQYGRYAYEDEINEDIFILDGQFFDDGFLSPHEFIMVDTKRQFRTLGIPILIQYHLDALVPGKIQLSLAAGVVANANVSAFSEEWDGFERSLAKYALDGQVGPVITFLIGEGKSQISMAPVFRIGLTNYSNNQPLIGISFAQSPVLKPYSMGLEVSYLWGL